MIELDGVQIWLSKDLFGTLLKLVHARISTPLGILQLGRMKVKRLRESIDGAMNNKRVSRDIIRVGLKHEYRLALASDEIAYRKSFRDLVAAKRIDPTIGESILRSCREV